MRNWIVLLVAALVAAPLSPSHLHAYQASRLAISLPEENAFLRLAQADSVVSQAQADTSAIQSKDADDGGSLGSAAEVGKSLLIPGWGQWSQDRRGLALVFFGIEAAIWTSFFVSQSQGSLRENSATETAQLYAGIDLDSKDDEFRRLVGQYYSSEEYNRLVVARRAANLYFGDPVAYRQYIDEYSLKGDDSWNWSSAEKFFQYGAERRSSDQAYQRAEYSLAAAVINRFASALAAWRLGPKGLQQTSLYPSLQTTAGRVEWTFLPDEDGGLEHRLAWVLDL